MHSYALAAAMPAGTPKNDVQIALAVPPGRLLWKTPRSLEDSKGYHEGLTYPGTTTALGADAAAVTSMRREDLRPHWVSPK